MEIDTAMSQIDPILAHSAAQRSTNWQMDWQSDSKAKEESESVNSTGGLL